MYFDNLGRLRAVMLKPIANAAKKVVDKYIPKKKPNAALAFLLMN